MGDWLLETDNDYFRSVRRLLDTYGVREGRQLAFREHVNDVTAVALDVVDRLHLVRVQRYPCRANVAAHPRPARNLMPHLGAQA